MLKAEEMHQQRLIQKGRCLNCGRVLKGFMLNQNAGAAEIGD